MVKNTLSLLLVGAGALLVAAKSKKKKKKTSASTKPVPEEPIPEDDPDDPPDDSVPDMGNPAAAFCVKNGGNVVLRRSQKGGAVGVCVMPDGGEVPSWKWTRGELTPGPAVDGLEAQGKVVVSKMGQAVTISFEEEPPTFGKPPTSLWQMTADSDLKPGEILIDEITQVPAPSISHRHFIFWTDKPGMGRAMFERVTPRGGVEQAATVMIETLEE